MILELPLAIIGVPCYYIMVFSSFPWPDSSSMTLGVRLVVRVGARLTVRLSSRPKPQPQMGALFRPQSLPIRPYP
jgi:hypothetical protein